MNCLHLCVVDHRGSRRRNNSSRGRTPIRVLYFSLGEICESMIPGATLEDPELKVLATTLPYLVVKGRADTTVEKYRAGWLGWLEWGKNKAEVTSRPAHPFYVALYLNHLFFTNGTKGSVTTAMYGIRWAHHAVGLDSPTDNKLVQMAYEGCMRLSKGHKTKKEAMPVEIIKGFVDEFSSGKSDLMEARFIIVCLIGFAGFFRIDELLKVQIKHITFFSDHITIFLPEAKTDQQRDGENVHIAQTGTKYCPVKHIKDFLRKSGIDVTLDKEAFLIPVLYKTKKGHKASKNRGISYTRANEIFHEELQKRKMGDKKFRIT